MLRDWDVWPIYLDPRWIDAGSAKRLARIQQRAIGVVEQATMTAAEARAWAERLREALAHPATRK